MAEEDKKSVKTVGDLRRMLRYSEDEEPLVCYVVEGDNDIDLDCSCATSTAGGRATILWFKYKDK